MSYFVLVFARKVQISEMSARVNMPACGVKRPAPQAQSIDSIGKTEGKLQGGGLSGLAYPHLPHADQVENRRGVSDARGVHSRRHQAEIHRGGDRLEDQAAPGAERLAQRSHGFHCELLN